MLLLRCQDHLLLGAHQLHRLAERQLEPIALDAATFEDQKVAGAIKTDFILSAEIMAIALATVADADLLTQAVVLGTVGLGITLAVYGVVALIVKADDAAWCWPAPAPRHPPDPSSASPAVCWCTGRHTFSRRWACWARQP